MIVDFGGGKLEIAVLKMERDKLPEIVSYICHCFGGEDFDYNLVESCVQSFE
jgi:molecular chaperone DnaK (HSP70)